MHASTPQHHLPGRCGHLVRRLFLLAGIDLQRCFCARCIAAHSGLFRRTRSWVGRRAYADVHVLGMRISHRFAFEMPMTAPPPVGGNTRYGRTFGVRRRVTFPLAHVLLGAHPLTRFRANADVGEECQGTGMRRPA